MDDLNGLVKETMRLQPTAFGITRTAAKDFEFNGYSIRKGRDEFKQAAFAPFGKGPHTCLGANYL